MSAAGARLTHAAVVVGAGLFLGLGLAVARLRRLAGYRPFTPTGRIALLGTFYNTNWFLSHARPLAASGPREVLVITDEPSRPLAGVRYVCPPRGLATVLGRPLSRALWAVWVGFRERPDLFMGYHILPNSVAALLAARLVGRAACYQMTGGPIEIEGGGIGSENSWLTRLRRPSPLIERLGIAAAREFDLVIVRGESARRWLEARRPRGRVEVVPGSVDPERIVPLPERSIDLLYVGRFTETKRPLAFVELVAAVAASRPELRAVMIGDGPLLEAARARARSLDVEAHVAFRGRQDEVAADLGRARVFVLTSRSEGLSIAMAEAMMAGAVPVVADVGDLGDLVREGENGYLVDVDDLPRFRECARRLLAEPVLWERLSRAARASAIASVGLDRVTALWARHLSAVLGPAARPQV
jgi:glycosyltransferase involved in cell wall biosynthesis